MMYSEKNKIRVLLVVVALLCLSLYYNGHSKSDPIPVRAAEAPRAPAPVLVRHVSRADELPSLPLLNQQPPLFSQSRRNVFEYSEGGNEAAPDADIDATADSDAPQTQNESQTTPGSEITFVGIYREKGKPDFRLAAVSIDKNILVVQKGDTLPGGYRVVKIEDDTLIVSLEAQKKILRIPLGRNAGSPAEQH